MANEPTNEDVIRAFTDGAMCSGCGYAGRGTDAVGQEYDTCKVIDDDLPNGYCPGAEFSCGGGNEELEADGFITLHPDFTIDDGW